MGTDLELVAEDPSSRRHVPILSSSKPAMPALTPYGPNLPVPLLAAHEEGRLIFFCGAGLSRLRAGLPLFGELVAKVYEFLRTAPEPDEAASREECDYDTTLELLERRIGAKLVRQAVAKILTVDDDIDVSAHLAVLRLSSTAGHSPRLVTTNFDLLFERAAQRHDLEIRTECPPALGVPKAHKWHSVVHLHGALDGPQSDHRDLVLTRADFGTAYLVERWASRFVTELFRNFTVLFVGYGLDDPVFRYLMDALASERAHGSDFSAAYAFAPLPTRGKKVRAAKERAWKAKGVIPLFYSEGTSHGHRHLDRTLERWSEVHVGGLRSRRSVALNTAPSPPQHSEEEDARLAVWALSEPSGVVAEAWASLSPPPPLEWLRILEDCDELQPNSILAFSPGVAERDPPQRQQLLLDSHSSQPASLGKPTWQLARWLTNFLSSLDLIKWVVERGCLLHPDLRRLVMRALENGPSLRSPCEKFWQLVSTDEYATRLATRRRPSSYQQHSLARRTEAGQWSEPLRSEFLEQFQPLLELRPEPDFSTFVTHLGGTRETAQEAKHLKDFALINVVLVGADSCDRLIESLRKAPEATAKLASAADELTSHLHEALRLNEFAGFPDWGASARSSISPHPQDSTRIGDWYVLIDMVRDSFLELSKIDTEAARCLVCRWQQIPFLLFSRLVLFAGTETNIPSADDIVRILLARRRELLWSVAVHRECLRFLRFRGGDISTEALDPLSTAILSGPSQKLFRDDIGHEDWLWHKHHETWIRLAKLRQAGARLSRACFIRLERLERRYGWKLNAHNLDEFMSRRIEDWEEMRVFTTPGLEASDPGEVARLFTETTGRQRGDLEEAWAGLVARRPLRAFRTLRILARRDNFPVDAWHRFFNSVPVEADRRRPLWLLVAKHLLELPESTLRPLVEPASHWLLNADPELSDNRRYTLYFNLWDRLFSLARKKDLDNDADLIHLALNRAAGQLARALLQQMWRERPRTGSGLSALYRSRLDRMASSSKAGVLSRVLLVMQLQPLFAVDPEWTRETALKWLEWRGSPFTRGLWEAFLHHPRIDSRLLRALRTPLLETVKRAGLQERARENLCRLIGFVGIQLPDAFGVKQSREALATMSTTDLVFVAEALTSLLESAGNEAGDLWRSQISHWMEECWPRDLIKRSPSLSNSLAELCISAGRAFPDALDQVQPYLVPLGDRTDSTRRLLRSDQIREHPEESLRLLDILVPAEVIHQPYRFHDLRQILDDLADAKPEMRAQPEFLRLENLVLQTRD